MEDQKWSEVPSYYRIKIFELKVSSPFADDIKRAISTGGTLICQ